MEKRIILLVCHASSSVGLGHLSRLLALAKFLKVNNNYQVEFLIFGEDFKKAELKYYKTYQFSASSDFINSSKQIIEQVSPSMVIFDLYPKLLPPNLEKFFEWTRSKDIRLIGIDSLFSYTPFLDHVWIPSFDSNLAKKSVLRDKLTSGWDSILLQKRLQTKKWKPGFRVLILTGGSDATGLGETLPTLLDDMLKEDTVLDWVKGPFSSDPLLPSKCKLNWNIHISPPHLDELIVQSNYVLTVFGLSFFEVLQYGIPSVVFSPYGKKDDNEMKSLAKEGVSLVSWNSIHAVEQLVELMKNDSLAQDYSDNSLVKMSTNGVKKLSSKIQLLLGDS